MGVVFNFADAFNNLGFAQQAAVVHALAKNSPLVIKSLERGMLGIPGKHYSQVISHH